MEDSEGTQITNQCGEPYYSIKFGESTVFTWFSDSEKTALHADFIDMSTTGETFSLSFDPAHYDSDFYGDQTSMVFSLFISFTNNIDVSTGNPYEHQIGQVTLNSCQCDQITWIAPIVEETTASPNTETIINLPLPSSSDQARDSFPVFGSCYD